jgi:hypothetical protein
VLFAYVAVALVVHVPWGTVLYSTFVPNFSLKTDYVVTVVAVLGTTITPYCFFWQASLEAEEERIDPTAHALLDAPEQAPVEISRMRLDTYSQTLHRLHRPRSSISASACEYGASGRVHAPDLRRTWSTECLCNRCADPTPTTRSRRLE